MADRGLRELLTLDDRLPTTPEALLVRVVRAVQRDEQDEPLGGRALKRMMKRNERLAATTSIGGGIGRQLGDMYCDVAVLCAIEHLHGMRLSDERLAAEALAMWGVMPDVESALAAIAGNGETTAARAGRMLAGQVDARTARDAVKLLWRLRGAAFAAAPRKPKLRHLVWPPRKVMRRRIATAERQLGLSAA